MGKVCTETHIRATQSAVVELYYQLSVREGARYSDVMEAKLSRVSLDKDGSIFIDKIPMLDREEGNVVLVTPRDPTGWCLIFSSDYHVGDSMVGLLEQPCPLSMNNQRWDEHLEIDEAIHGYLIESTMSWGWARHHKRIKTEFKQTGSLEAPSGRDLKEAFADLGRLFGQVDFERVLHRLLDVSRPENIDEYRLLWVRGSRKSWA